MPDKQTSLTILKKEKDYEENVVASINSFLTHLQTSQNIPLEQDTRQTILQKVTKIMKESQAHAIMLQKLIKYINQQEKDDF
jgi:hypothetical protein